VDFALPGEDDPRRVAFRAWSSEHPSPSSRDLAAAGYVAPHWPRPWGLGADPVTQLVIDDELRRAGLRRPDNPIGIGWAGPTLIHAGSTAQQERYLPSLLSGEEFWCQLFSEPGAGSDLAALSTRAVLDGEDWVVTGQKVWTSFAHRAAFGILLARTDPEAPKQQGISYFICPMDLPGITVRPLVDMTGDHTFNEVFFDEVRIPHRNLVGEVNRGWALAKVTLGNERVSLSGAGALWGQGPTAQDLVNVVRDAGGERNPLLRQRLARVWGDGEILRLIRLRMISAALSGIEPGAEASVRKALADQHGQDVMALAKDLAGSAGMLAVSTPAPPVSRVPAPKAVAAPTPAKGAFRWPASIWGQGFLFAPALTIGGGTAEVQRNIIGERTLGLPRDPES
jgi:alkylation response protein AidB-like acyl-CoA dehydrogenase